MLRNLVLASATCLGLAAPLGVAAPARAASVHFDVHVGIGPVHRRPAAVVVEPVRVYRPAPVVVTTPAPVVVAPAPVVYAPAPCPTYCVQYRGCGIEPWREYAVYGFRDRAVLAETSLARRGYEVRIVRH